MENLTKALEGLKLEDLKKEDSTTESNLIEPTEAEIKLIIAELQAGKEYKEIKKTIRREEGISKLGFSYGQIREIDLAREAKIAELTPKEEPIVEEPVIEPK